MKLSKLYSNKPQVFKETVFRDGLNVILAEIRLPENRGLDTHNLGKTTVGRLIDFCLLKKFEKKTFVYKNSEALAGFDFYLELVLISGTCLTIRRSVDSASKISIVRHDERNSNFVNYPEKLWDHFEIPFDRAKQIVDAALDLSVLKPEDFRKGLGYQIRLQDDFLRVFEVSKFARSAHIYWKPFLAGILGFDSELILDHYEADAELSEKSRTLNDLRAEMGGEDIDVSMVEGQIQLVEAEIEVKESGLREFNFSEADSVANSKLVEDVEAELSRLNSEKYYLSKTIKRLNDALKIDKIVFPPAKVEKLFEEAGVLFPGQLRTDFETLIRFNKSITKERSKYLSIELEEAESRRKEVSKAIGALQNQRASLFSFLEETKSLAKFRELTEELTDCKADLVSLIRLREQVARLDLLKEQIGELKLKKIEIEKKAKANIDQNNKDKLSIFSQIRTQFSLIVKNVLSETAFLTVRLNSEGNPEFETFFRGPKGKVTSAGDGHTYKKLLCIAFDTGLARAYSSSQFPRFLFHDGALDTLEPRKAWNLLEEFRRSWEDFGVQHVIAILDSDLPVGFELSKDEVVLTLHDDGDEGRLFMMPAF